MAITRIAIKHWMWIFDLGPKFAKTRKIGLQIATIPYIGIRFLANRAEFSMGIQETITY